MTTTSTSTRKPRSVTIKGQSFNLDTRTGWDACNRVIDRMFDNVDRLQAAERNALAKSDRLNERGNRAMADTMAAVDALGSAMGLRAPPGRKRATSSGCKPNPRSV